jgi:hypothetical protein
LHDDLATVVLEIDVYIRRFPSLETDESLEEQIIPVWIYGGDAQNVANGGIGCRTPSLAQYPLAASETYNRVNRQKVGSIIKRTDQAELMLNGGADLVWNPIRITAPGALPGKMFE